MGDNKVVSGGANKDILHLSTREVFVELQKVTVLIDIREDYHTAMKTFLVENYCILPFSIFDENIINLPTDRLLIIADATGLHSKTLQIKAIKPKSADLLMCQKSPPFSPPGSYINMH